MERRSGVIISLSSINALTGVHLAAYTAAKGGILSLTRLLAQQYGAYGIRANAICPGTIMTETSRVAYDAAPQLRDELRAMYPAGEFGVPEDIADCAVWLAGSGSRFVELVVAHGVLELSCIAVAGMAGLRLGAAVIAPGPPGLFFASAIAEERVSS